MKRAENLTSGTVHVVISRYPAGTIGRHARIVTLCGIELAESTIVPRERQAEPTCRRCRWSRQKRRARGRDA